MLSSIVSPFMLLFTSRTVILMFATTFSIFVIMLMLNIITIPDVKDMFNLSNKSTCAIQTVAIRLQEVCGNIGGILSQLLQKLLGFAGVESDLSKIKIDLNGSSNVAIVEIDYCELPNDINIEDVSGDIIKNK